MIKLSLGSEEVILHDKPVIIPGIGGETSVTITLDKYFPYDNGNGQPIYDENTGTELRDPVTGEPK
jgi:hypothetical protein